MRKRDRLKNEEADFNRTFKIGIYIYVVCEAVAIAAFIYYKLK